MIRKTIKCSYKEKACAFAERYCRNVIWLYFFLLRCFHDFWSTGPEVFLSIFRYAGSNQGLRPRLTHTTQEVRKMHNVEILGCNFMRILLLDFWRILKLSTKGLFIRSKTAECSNISGFRLRRVRTTTLSRFIFQEHKEFYLPKMCRKLSKIKENRGFTILW